MKKLFIAAQMLSCFSFAAAPAAKNPPCPVLQRGDDSLQSLPNNSGQYPGAYNSPADVSLSSGWDVYGDLSYIYWYVNEDGLDLATTGAYITGEYEVVNGVANGVSAVFQDSNYTSGFKIGLGANLNHDDWLVDLGYTYLRASTTASYNHPTSTTGISVYNFTGWVVPFYSTSGDQATGADQFNSKLSFGLDWLDLMFKRPYYQGCALTVTPSAGLRASWISQTLKITTSTARTYEFAPYDLFSKTSSRSWAIGPRGLVDARWIIAKGFRFQGSVGASLLFTQYTQLKHSDNGVIYDGTYGASMSFRNFNCLRPMAEGNLGMGWGSYFSKNRYHWDLSATYDFNYLWNQNMLRYVVNLNSQAFSPNRVGPAYGTGAAFYDAYLHGLTINTRFDF